LLADLSKTHRNADRLSLFALHEIEKKIKIGKFIDNSFGNFFLKMKKEDGLVVHYYGFE